LSKLRKNWKTGQTLCVFFRLFSGKFFSYYSVLIAWHVNVRLCLPDKLNSSDCSSVQFLVRIPTGPSLTNLRFTQFNRHNLFKTCCISLHLYINDSHSCTSLSGLWKVKPPGKVAVCVSVCLLVYLSIHPSLYICVHFIQDLFFQPPGSFSASTLAK
jgi:hypothetical protein